MANPIAFDHLKLACLSSLFLVRISDLWPAPLTCLIAARSRIAQRLLAHLTEANKAQSNGFECQRRNAIIYRPPPKNEKLRLVRQRPPQQTDLGLCTRAAVRMCQNGLILCFSEPLFQTVSCGMICFLRLTTPGNTRQSSLIVPENDASAMALTAAFCTKRVDSVFKISTTNSST